MSSTCQSVIGRGSSPLARGLPLSAPVCASVARIIPARAGFTPRGVERALTPGDHPRSRGVYEYRVRGSEWRAGSSPLARGLRSGTRRWQRSSGIIPARAGFTRFLSRVGLGFRDHPRSRGVYTKAGDLHHMVRGSSPLARGLRRRFAVAMAVSGIIPARAGFTHPCRTPPAPHPDHPRSRGVYFSEPKDHRSLLGSSPLARGLRQRAAERDSP